MQKNNNIKISKNSRPPVRTRVFCIEPIYTRSFGAVVRGWQLPLSWASDKSFSGSPWSHGCLIFLSGQAPGAPCRAKPPLGLYKSVGGPPGLLCAEVAKDSNGRPFHPTPPCFSLSQECLHWATRSCARSAEKGLCVVSPVVGTSFSGVWYRWTLPQQLLLGAEWGNFSWPYKVGTCSWRDRPSLTHSVHLGLWMVTHPKEANAVAATLVWQGSLPPSPRVSFPFYHSGTWHVLPSLSCQSD